MNFLLDEFRGDPHAFYELVVEEVNRRQFPGVEFGWLKEAETVGLFTLGRTTDVLRVSFEGMSVHVLAYQVGRCFYVSAHVAHTPKPRARDGKLQKIALRCFGAMVPHAARAALARHLTQRHTEVPKDLLKEGNLFPSGSSEEE